MIIGITGGIATGKSTIVKYLLRMGNIIIDADKISREIIEEKEIIEKIVDEFGKEIIKSKKIDRPKLRELVFNDEEKLKKLNAITHPAILNKINLEIEKNKDKKIIFVDIPLLYEVGFEKNVDKVLVVYSSYEIQLKRLMERDNISYDLAQNMIKSQMNLKEKIDKADYIIDNNGNLKEFEDKIMKNYKLIKKEAI